MLLHRDSRACSSILLLLASPISLLSGAAGSKVAVLARRRARVLESVSAGRDLVDGDNILGLVDACDVPAMQRIPFPPVHSLRFL